MSTDGGSLNKVSFFRVMTRSKVWPSTVGADISCHKPKKDNKPLNLIVSGCPTMVILEEFVVRVSIWFWNSSKKIVQKIQWVYGILYKMTSLVDNEPLSIMNLKYSYDCRLESSHCLIFMLFLCILCYASLDLPTRLLTLIE